MATINKHSWGAVKPPLGAQVDWGHPLTRGLVSAHIPQASSSVDLVGKELLSIEGGARVDHEGVVIDTTDASVSAPLPNRLRLSFPITIVAKVRFDGTPVINSGIFGACHNPDGDPPYLPWQLFVNAEGRMTIAWNDNGSFGSLTNTLIPTAGETYFLAGRLGVTPDGKRLDVNDIPYQETGGLIGVPTYGASPKYGFGELFTSVTLSRAINGKVFFGYVFNRDLSDSEIAALYRDPYCFIQAPSTRQYFLMGQAEAQVQQIVRLLGQAWM